MSKKLKLFISSTLIALCLSPFHRGWAMEEQKNPEQANSRVTVRKFLRHATRFLSKKPPFVEDLQKTNRILISNDSSDKASVFEKCPIEIKLHILKYAVMDAILDDEVAGRLPAVCKEWQTIIKDNKVDIFRFAICQEFSVDQEICQQFLNGRLIYQPNEDSDEGKIEMRIADLANPLKGTFDLSQCGDAGEHLSISTGYRKGKKAKNKKKVEIWFVPRFLVEKKINESARHFKEIFPRDWSDKASVGIIWTDGNENKMDWYNYLTKHDMEGLSDDNLHQKWYGSYAAGLGRRAAISVGGAGREGTSTQRSFHVRFGRIE